MRICWLISLLSLTGLSCRAQVDSFHTPWQDTSTAILIDAYHLNEINWDSLVTDQRVVGVIHKASDGDRVDTAYANRRQEALNRNLLWGSYHMGRPGNAKEQARHYLNTVSNDSTELLVLDLEEVENPRFMSLDSAVVFVQFIHDSTGRYPAIYSNHNTLRQISEHATADSLFAHCPLWYARFRDDIPDWIDSTWSCYDMWQFSCEINCNETGNCVYNVPGVLFDMDVNVINRPIAEVRETWPLIND